MKELTVILKKDKAGVFSAHVLQEAREGPNLLQTKPHDLFTAKQKAELKLRRDGFKGSVIFVGGYPSKDPPEYPHLGASQPPPS